MTALAKMHNETAAAMRERVSTLLNADPACNGAVSDATVAMIGEMAALGAVSPLEAITLGRLQERADVLAFLEGRVRAARTIADRNPEQAERARDLAQQVDIEIEAIGQGMHEGDAAKAEQVPA